MSRCRPLRSPLTLGPSRRLTALAWTALLLALVAGCGRPGAGESAPDDVQGESLTGSLKGRVFILVVADSMHAGHLSAYGYHRETSPFLERLAKTGIRARRALSQTCWTLSSVMSLFTGLVQEHHGILLQTQKVADDGPRTLAEMFKAAGYRTMAFQENPAASRRTGVGRGFDKYFMKRSDLGRTSQTIEAAHVQVSKALKEGAQPLFVYVHMLAPHMPYTPPEPYASLYREVEGSEVTGSYHDCARIQAEELAPDHPDNLRLIETYDAHVTFADERIRLLIEPLLESHGEEICVLFTSDHGEAFMQHKGTGHNTLCYDEMVSIPWILCAPGALPQGVEISDVVSTLDAVPTVAQLFGLELPRHRLDGTSLVETFAGVPDRGAARPLPPRELFLSSRYAAKEDGMISAQAALVEGPWKYLDRRREGLRSLFNLDDDPMELNDLSGAEPERAQRMGARFDELRAQLLEEGPTTSASPLDSQTIRDLESLGYGGEQFDVPDAQKK